MKTEKSNALNAICPYFTMFPINFPEGIIDSFYRPNTAIFDPFCGRGTSLFAARKKSIFSIGVDSSPVAVASAQAKLINTTPEKIMQIASIFQSSSQMPEIPSGEFWEYAFEKSTLIDICKFRQSLLDDCSTPERQALKAIILGALHGPLSKNTTSYFSNQCPRTYAPKPNYSVKYWKEHGMFPPKVNVMSLIEVRANRYFAELPAFGKGFVIYGDCRNNRTFIDIQNNLNYFRTSIGLIITSPPYYGMRTYIPDQWLRNWFVGGPPYVDYDTSNQISHNSIETFSQELEKVWLNCSGIASANTTIAIRFGAINDRKVDPEEIIRYSLRNVPCTILDIQKAGIPAKKSRQVYSFSGDNTPKDQIEEIDIVAVLNN